MLWTSEFSCFFGISGFRAPGLSLLGGGQGIQECFFGGEGE